ncbi:MAG: hypothetical protein M9962_11215 [Oligoflexia bacterium]|nr:hypothetical protein [Oligoflexia bacterium]
MNPCKLKGQYGKRGDAGRLDARPLLQGEGKACECKYAFLDSNPESLKRTHYLMEFGRKGVLFRPSDPKKKPLRGTQMAVPCEEIFQNRDSIGSKRFIRAMGKNTKFRGCTSLEQELIDSGSVVHRMAEENIPKGMLLGKRIKEGRVPDAVDFNDSSLNAHYQFLDGFYEDANSLFVEEKTFRDGPTTSLSIYFGLNPENILESTLEYLYQGGAFAHDLELEVTAQILLFIGFDTVVIKKYFPWYPLEKYPILTAEVFKIVNFKMHPALRKFTSFWKSLTKAQQQAMKLVYMDSLSVQKAAAIAKIKRYSMLDRLEGAKKKLFAHYPEHQNLLRKNKRSPETDLAFGGFYRRSSVRKKSTVRQKNLITGEWREIPTPTKAKKSRRVSGRKK